MSIMYVCYKTRYVHGQSFIVRELPADYLRFLRIQSADILRSYLASWQLLAHCSSYIGGPAETQGVGRQPIAR